MELSLYSHQFIRDNKFYLYNSENNLFIQISEKLYRNLYNKEFYKIEKETWQELVRNRFIVKKEELYNYYYEQKMRFMADSYNTEFLNLVVVPTTGCNFACPYCFEGEKNMKIMSNDIITNLINFIKGHEKAKKLSLTWYGGEPLMAFNHIEEIVKRIKNETELEIVSQSIITNGYLITDKMIAFFSQNKFRSIQITIDGVKESHDKTRFLAKGHSSTYDRIMNNIKKVTTALPNCNILVRVNINKKNADDFDILYKSLHTLLPHDNLYVYPGFIREENYDGCKMCYESLYNNSEVYSFYEKMSRKGVHINFMPQHPNKGCMVNKINSYIIGPSGEIYKCWNDVNNPKKIIGNIKMKDIDRKSVV